jgi:hypothetical protein
MPVNFTGSEQPAADARSAGRTRLVILSCFATAAVLAGVVFAAALGQRDKIAAPSLAPILVGTDRTLAAVPGISSLSPIERTAAQPSASAPAAPPPATPAKPKALDPAVAKARMLAALRQAPHGTITLVVEDDAGAAAYAQKLTELFRAAGWTVDQSSTFGPGASRRGLAAAFGVSPADEAVREAFDAVGFQFQSPPRDAGVIRTPEIFVGAPYGAGR